MTKIKLLSASLLAGGVALAASQSAMAYEAGDILIRGGVAKTSPKGDAEGNMSKENGFVGSLGYMFHDKMGVSLGSSQEFEHDFSVDGDGGSFDQQPIDLMVQYYPLGGLDARVQPYAGVGANYTRFSSESDGLNLDNTWAPKGELGVDLLITRNLSLNGFASYTDLDADYSFDGGASGEADIDPVTVGGGVTLRF